MKHTQVNKKNLKDIDWMNGCIWDL